MHATGVGKVLLAYAPDDVRQRVLAGPLPRFLPRTITSPALLASQLDRVRADGYATTDEEMTSGARSVGVPIVTGDGVVGALGFVVADLRRSRVRLVAACRWPPRASRAACSPPERNEAARSVRDPAAADRAGGCHT